MSVCSAGSCLIRALLLHQLNKSCCQLFDPNQVLSRYLRAWGEVPLSRHAGTGRAVRILILDDHGAFTTASSESQDKHPQQVRRVGILGQRDARSKHDGQDDTREVQREESSWVWGSRQLPTRDCNNIPDVQQWYALMFGMRYRNKIHV